MTIRIAGRHRYPIAGVGGIIRAMSDVVHIYGSSYETCPVCGEKCAYGGEANGWPAGLLFGPRIGKSVVLATWFDTSGVCKGSDPARPERAT